MTGRDDVDGFAPVPNWIVRDTSISGNAKLVYMCLISRANRNQQTWPSHALIAKEAKVSVSSVKTALVELRELGVVTWSQQRRNDGGLSSNMYRVLIEPPRQESPTP